MVLVHHPRSGFQTGAVASTSAASLHLGPPTPLELGRVVAGGPSAGSEKCAAQLTVQRLEAALGAFGSESSPEKDAIEGFLIRARAQAKVRSVEERSKSCEEYLARCLKRLEEVQGRSGEDTRKGRTDLREEASVKHQRETTPPDPEAKVTRLRIEVAEERHRKGNGHGSDRGSHSFQGTEPMPHTTQVLECMSCKQQELQDILQFGGSRNVVLELTSQLAEGADLLHSLQDDVVMR